jgi:hypothetical protein
VLEGDADGLAILSDRLQEAQEPVMQSLKIGGCYLVQTTHKIYTGRVEAVSFTDVVLAEAALVRYDGPLHRLLQRGEPRSVDPFPNKVIISTAVIYHAIPWDHPLPREPKEDPGEEIPF